MCPVHTSRCFPNEIIEEQHWETDVVNGQLFCVLFYFLNGEQVSLKQAIKHQPCGNFRTVQSGDFC